MAVWKTIRPALDEWFASADALLAEYDEMRSWLNVTDDTQDRAT